MYRRTWPYQIRTDVLQRWPSSVFAKKVHHHGECSFFSRRSRVPYRVVCRALGSLFFGILLGRSRGGLHRWSRFCRHLRLRSMGSPVVLVLCVLGRSWWSKRRATIHAEVKLEMEPLGMMMEWTEWWLRDRFKEKRNLEHKDALNKQLSNLSWDSCRSLLVCETISTTRETK